ncbi:MAG: molybdopterin molybdotransferase MoeA [Gammaproteobacteria bacterium]|nr:molybdopterin molybdotransferase MoeA [Gammaproteobacteria bacterium]MCW8839519.1 molybdopterin molybdotransferase MoeA [Gammaproteobacteria bacterium]MCW8928443.1 molybdopterin molybdotransferase MoeA [Gammaproteobacteria bacterium]MCW8959602.1 molybdopterin molybdotransferase MoeA [Gammaproteobacteria bacterium]MCW8971844.1 molybdopterin molybdotransferase MoeA [Gammaproteobacteria bacterium]
MTDTHQTANDYGSQERSDLLSVDEALQQIRKTLEPVEGFERCPLQQTFNRIVAEPVISPINVPGHVNSAMDGYAVSSTDLPSGDADAVLQVTGTAFAGNPFAGTLQNGQAVRIMTGAVVPEGADTVIMQEAVTREGDSITLQAGHKAGENVRHIGEDIAEGGVVLAPGKKIRAAEMGLLASLGIGEVTVSRRLRVATFSTGDELCSIGEIPREGQIFDSNRYSIAGMLRALNTEHIDMGVIRDDPEAISNAFSTAAKIADVLITSGGVSVGDADYVKQTLDKLGQVNFWKIKMKPGKPLAFGQLKDAVFFGLPGNPVSVMATFYEIVQPSLRHMMGQETHAPLRVKVRCVDKLRSPARQDFQRGILERDDSGEWVVRSTGHQGSHILSSMSQANCFIVLDAECRGVEPGEWVEVEPFEGLF